MGGYDLYGNYYKNEIDAINAEIAQCNEIDNRIIKNKNEELEYRISELETYVSYLENRISELEKLLKLK